MKSIQRKCHHLHQHVNIPTENCTEKKCKKPDSFPENVHIMKNYYAV